MDTKVLLEAAKKDYSAALNVGALITMGELPVQALEILESFLIFKSWISKLGQQEEDKKAHEGLIEMFQRYISCYESLFHEKEFEIGFFLRSAKLLSEEGTISEEQLKIVKDFMAEMKNLSEIPESWKAIRLG